MDSSHGDSILAQDHWLTTRTCRDRCGQDRPFGVAACSSGHPMGRWRPPRRGAGLAGQHLPRLLPGATSTPNWRCCPIVASCRRTASHTSSSKWTSMRCGLARRLNLRRGEWPSVRPYCRSVSWRVVFPKRDRRRPSTRPSTCGWNRGRRAPPRWPPGRRSWRFPDRRRIRPVRSARMFVHIVGTSRRRHARDCITRRRRLAGLLCRTTSASLMQS